MDLHSGEGFGVVDCTSTFWDLWFLVWILGFGLSGLSSSFGVFCNLGLFVVVWWVRYGDLVLGLYVYCWLGWCNFLYD